MYGHRVLPIAAMVVMALFITGCSDDDDPVVLTATPPGDVVEVATANGLSTLTTAAVAAQLDGALATLDPITVFAPTNDAFASLDSTWLNNLITTDTATLSSVLLYHVANGEKNADAVIADSATGITTNISPAQNVIVDVVGGNVFINQAQVITPNVPAENGIVHVINSVLVPGQGDAASTLTLFEDAIGSSGDGFGTLLSLITALPSDSQTIVLNTINASGGTLFAPLDSAFDAGTVSYYNGLTTAQKVDLLAYHFYNAGAVKASTAISLDGNNITMANGDDAAILVTGGVLSVDGADVELFNIPTNNNTIIHAVSSVLVPVVVTN